MDAKALEKASKDLEILQRHKNEIDGATAKTLYREAAKLPASCIEAGAEAAKASIQSCLQGLISDKNDEIQSIVDAS